MWSAGLIATSMKFLYSCASLLFILSATPYSLEVGDAIEYAQVQSRIISAVSDGAGWFKFVNGMPKKGSILRANFTNLINTTG